MEKLKRSLGSFIVPLLSIILAFVIGGIIMAALGANPFDAVKYLFQGAFGSKANIGTTLTKATPLMFTSLCACFAYKCGVFNLGGEGQFLMGSIAAFVTAYFSGVTGFAGVLLALLAGTLAGGIWGMIPGLLKIGRGQNEMIISIMLNYVATLFMGVLYTSWIRDASVPQTPAVDDLVKLPRVITGMRFTWGFVIAVVVGLVLYYVLFWTSGGFKLRAVGYNMTASRFNGIHVKRCMLTSFIISGAIAGLGGGAAQEQLGVGQQGTEVDHSADADEEQQREQLVGHARLKQGRNGADGLALGDGTRQGQVDQNGTKAHGQQQARLHLFCDGKVDEQRTDAPHHHHLPGQIPEIGKEPGERVQKVHSFTSSCSGAKGKKKETLATAPCL